MDNPSGLITAFEQKVSDTVRKYHMIDPGDRIIAAVSGGADSMALLTAFNTLSRITPFNFTVAHVNHGIREAEADRDEAFVREVCSGLGIPFSVAHLNVPETASQTGEGVEECGRRLRYSFFRETDPEAKIATAHNLNDCEETFLFNLARGASLRGLTGIPPVRDNIIRPLIECSRKEIEEYLTAKNVEHVTDSTNFSDDYSRNRIRHIIIPVLKELNPEFDAAFLNCTNTLKADDSELDRLAGAVVAEARRGDGFIADVVLSQQEAVRNRSVINIFKLFGCSEPEYRHVRLFTETGSVNLPGDITVTVYKGLIRNISGFTESKKLELIPVLSEQTAGLTPKELSQGAYADMALVRDAAVRKRRPGDRFLPPGSNCSRSLKNMFSDNNVPANKREKALILEKNSVILYVEGIGTSAYAIPNNNTIETVRLIPNAD